MRTTKSADRARFTRQMPLNLKSVWTLDESYRIPILFNNPTKEGKKALHDTTITLTAIYGSVLEYRYKSPFAVEYFHGLVDISVFLDKAKKV